jgi:hypothetical protein
MAVLSVGQGGGGTRERSVGEGRGASSAPLVERGRRPPTATTGGPPTARGIETRFPSTIYVTPNRLKNGDAKRLPAELDSGGARGHRRRSCGDPGVNVASPRAVRWANPEGRS